jgi:hypothetical protein
LILQGSSKIQPEFDVQFARRIFASSSEELSPQQITSPWDLYAVEALRDRHGLRFGNDFPTDVFVFGKGEPEDPACTKVGGRPFWPEEEPWPSQPDGSPCGFLAQFNFADSADLVGDDAAGCVLVIATNGQPDWLSDENSLSFHWVDRRIANVAKLNVPSAIGNAGPFWGAVHRTADFPNAYDAAYELNIAQSYNLPILNATKIGGFPHFVQKGLVTEREFLCQLASIQAAPEVPFPWVNQRQPLSIGFDEGGMHHDTNSAVFYDMGNIYMFFNDTGEITWHFECS